MPFKTLFPDNFRDAILSGKQVEYEIDGESGYFFLDKTHGECLCTLIDGEETPLFNIKYLDSNFRVNKWKS